MAKEISSKPVPTVRNLEHQSASIKIPWAAAILPPDPWVAAFGFVVVALTIGVAINIANGQYDPTALGWVSAAMAASIVAVVVRDTPVLRRVSQRCLLAAMVFGIALECLVLIRSYDKGLYPRKAILAACALGTFCIFTSRWKRHVLIALTLLLFSILMIVVLGKYPMIDVFQFQHAAADAFLHGHNPYTIRVPSIYPASKGFYGPGVVVNGIVTYGYPYTPMSLFMILPGQLLGDLRYSHVAAVVISAALMAYARPGRWGMLAATLFLFTPRVIFILQMSWTEPLIILSFSLLMFCACRYPRFVPYALGIFFAMKQYTIFAVPAAFLLVSGPDQFRNYIKLILKAIGVTLVLTLPMAIWDFHHLYDFHEFYRSVVLWQLVQPFRKDALSYLVWMVGDNTPPTWAIWAPCVMVIPAIAIALRRCPRSPAGFAAAITFIYLIFFAFNKQAFCNYYYFTIASACWVVASMDTRPIADNSDLKNSLDKTKKSVLSSAV